MSEDDRAAKAARAKAMLKKRQQKKTGGPSATGVASPISLSRALSPAPSEPVEEEKRDLGDVFTKDDSDTSWLTLLPRAASPRSLSARVSSSPVSSQSSLLPASANVLHLVPSPITGLDTAVQGQVDSLQLANATLTAEVTRLRGLDSKLQQTEALLEEERTRVYDLEEEFRKFKLEKEKLLQNEQQTISLLVSERSSLTAELQRLEDVDTNAQTTGILLQQERSKLERLEGDIRQLQLDAKGATERGDRLQAAEKELTEKCREQERQIHLFTASIKDLRQETEQHQRRVRELEDQIQSDDRVERLESSLKNTQDRADELEFQLSKLKQAHTTLKAERDDIETQRRSHHDNELEWRTKYSELDSQHSSILQQFSTVASERDTLVQDKSSLQFKVDSVQMTFEEVQQKLTQITSEAATYTRQLQVAQNELKNASRRAEDAEKAQKDLQAEGTNLMHSLDEMRPKIIELTGVKLELGEKIDSLEHALRGRDSVVAQLESTVDELRDQMEQSDKQWRETLSTRENEYSSVLTNLSELQKAYSSLQEELETSLASLRNLEVERTNHHQEATRRITEIERLSTLLSAQTGELSELRQELDERRGERDEEQDILERAQNEIEGLRAELSAKEEEIERLEEEVSSPSRGDVPRSLDEEMLSSLRQQHALDLSSAQSQIRALENSVFGANARAHALQKQVNTLEDQLKHIRSAPRPPQRPFSPGIPSRPSSRGQTADDLRRASFSSHRPSTLAPRSIFDQNLTPETRHKRKISLSMLKARIDSEVSAATNPSRALSPAFSLPTVKEPSSPSTSSLDHHHRPQFLDESHVFWCHSCRGDLVIL